MNRRKVPHIQPSVLRDVASEERVDRIWNRLEQDLATARVRPAGRATRTVVWAAAATFVAFGAGLASGRVVWHEPQAGPSAVAAAHDRTETDVFAAGSQERTYALPGGGRITLQPGSMIEMEHGSGSDLRLRLLSGQASLDTAQAGQGALAIVSGEATVATAPDSVVQVQKRDDNIDVRVASGSAQVSSPAGTRALRRGERMDGVPTRVTTSAVNQRPVVHVASTPGPTAHVARSDASAAPAAQVAVAPGWRELHKDLKWDEALALLKAQPGGIAGAIDSAKSAGELMIISDLARWKGGETAQGFRALQIVADTYPSTQQGQTAAYLLGKHYETTQPDLAKKYLALAAQKGVLSEDAICAQMRQAQNAGNKDEAAARATEYLGAYPNGRCKDDANRILSGGDADGDGEPSGADAAPSAPAPSASSSAASSSAPAENPAPQQ